MPVFNGHARTLRHKYHQSVWTHVRQGCLRGRSPAMASPDETASAKKPPSWLINAIAPVALALAGRRWFPAWAQLRHRGRRTGKEYVIPVAVLTRPDAFVIGLPWGTGTNWVRNVLAAGGCAITWKGTEYQVTDPRLVNKE